jgi:hypothetical protein
MDEDDLRDEDLEVLAVEVFVRYDVDESIGKKRWDSMPN